MFIKNKSHDVAVVARAIRSTSRQLYKNKYKSGLMWAESGLSFVAHPGTLALYGPSPQLKNASVNAFPTVHKPSNRILRLRSCVTHLRQSTRFVVVRQTWISSLAPDGPENSNSLSFWCIISHREIRQHPYLGSLNIFFQVTWNIHSTFFEPLVIGTTFSGSPSIFTVFAGWSSLIKIVSKIFFPCGHLPACHPTTCPSCSFVMHNFVALIFQIITGIPMQSEGFPGKCWVADSKLFSVKWGLFDGTHKSGNNWGINVSNLFNALSC
jgi:hypothetical protein